jgi:hypothetical protein
MKPAILIPYRPDTPQRERIQATTSRLWHEETGFRPTYSDDGLTGPHFSFARAVNRARANVKADYLIVYNADALPISPEAIAKVWHDLMDGVPWIALFDGQQHFTYEQTEQLLAGENPVTQVGPARGPIAMGREALLGIRADVFDDLRGYDERFVGWGLEDFAIHRVLTLLYPDGCDKPEYGLFQSLWHPHAPRTRFDANNELWHRYLAIEDPAEMRAFYLSRP